jgi:hypothetical protein
MTTFVNEIISLLPIPIPNLSQGSKLNLQLANMVCFFQVDTIKGLFNTPCRGFVA